MVESYEDMSTAIYCLWCINWWDFFGKQFTSVNQKFKKKKHLLDP